MLGLVKELKTDSEGNEGGRCIRLSDGILRFNEKERGKVWKEMQQMVHKTV